MLKNVVILTIFGVLAAFGATTLKPGKLSKIEEKYSSAKSFSANVKKTLKLKILEQERSLEGTVQIKKPGMFRLEFSKPEASLVITDGITMWMATLPVDPDFDNTTRVIRSKNTDRIQAQALVTFLLGRGGLLKEFSLQSSVRKGDISTYSLKPKKKNDEVTKVEISVSEKAKEMLSIRYWDALENETRLEFSDSKFGVELPGENFTYKIPKGAEVTDI